MKIWIIKITSAALLFGFVFTGCAEPRHYERDRDDQHHQRDHHNDNDHHDDDHHDNDNH
jgi:ABC-type nickel/cobalt efflux system permease component RcnA